jgi:hypothetical protein
MSFGIVSSFDDEAEGAPLRGTRGQPWVEWIRFRRQAFEASAALAAPRRAADAPGKGLRNMGAEAPMLKGGTVTDA